MINVTLPCGASSCIAEQGSAVLSDQIIAAWATKDFVCGGRGDIGFFTRPEHGQAHDLSRLSWTCAEDNAGSIRLAEKLGCERERDYLMYIFAFDEGQHLAQLAYAHLLEGEYEKTVDVYQSYLTRSDDLPAWAYYDLARAWAGLGNRAKAFEALRSAIDRGWTGMEEAKECQEFEGMAGSLEWDLLGSMHRPIDPAQHEFA